ncbi:hypothetical protein SCLCIDRAFT_33934 [Scleroderma citrinum Foug A]|uniref:Uncharacterized protein n=1 Tax=Scleroderma citrinum Foug A TaxID=1036808 RepID=A0A0C2ZCY9_9AGAM|nr:hypothetical protein SCLCIDRAFT_33934 [Scleroderma citrinum Foug A]
MLRIQDALAAQPCAPSTATSCSLTSIVGNIQKMEVMMVHMHKAELITVLLNMSIESLHARGVMTIIQMTKVTILVIMCATKCPSPSQAMSMSFIPRFFVFMVVFILG